MSLFTLGDLSRRRGDRAAAEAHYREALSIRLQRFGAAHPQTAVAQVALGEVLIDRGAGAEADPLVRGALAVLRKAFSATHVDVVRAEPAVARLR